jgi:hypothetical protein
MVQNPGITQLMNATKVCRTASGWAWHLQRLSAATTCTPRCRISTSGAQREVTQPPPTTTHCGVQSLKNNHFLRELRNTNVTRAGSTYDANVTAVSLRQQGQQLRLPDGGWCGLRRRVRAFWQNEEIDDQNGAGSPELRQTGHIWSVDHGIESHAYNPNDLGLLFANNNISQSVNGLQHLLQPF